MKNATKHADELKTLFKRLQKDGKPEARQTIEPLKALVRGAMSYDVSDARADEAMRAIEKEFVDLNELRVATELEVQEMLGTKYPDIEARVSLITQSLNSIFEREHTLSLDRLRTISKRDARQFLRDLPGMNPFVEGYVMLMAFDGHSVPMDQQLLEFFAGHGVVTSDTNVEDAQRFVEHQLKAEDCHDFFVCCRRAVVRSQDHSDGEKRKKAK